MEDFLNSMEKPNYIKKIETDKNICLSIMNLPDATEDFIKFTSEKFELVDSLGDMGLDIKITFKEKLYLTKQEFYLYLLITDDKIKVRIYYQQKQLNELKLIIGQLLKQKNLWKLQQKN